MRRTLALIFFAGLLLNGLVLAPIIGEVNPTGQFDGLGLWVALAQGLGGGLAGYLLASAFGRDGIGGWIVAIFGAVTVILLGAVAAGILVSIQGMLTASDGYLIAGLRGGTTALAIPVSMISMPILWALPPALAILAHLVARRARHEAAST